MESPPHAEGGPATYREPDRERVEGEPVVTGQHAEPGRQDLVWDVRPAAGWREFVAGRERYLALLAAQSASWMGAGRLPTRAVGGYARPQAGQGEGARSQ
jgi:hypothetical protein